MVKFYEQGITVTKRLIIATFLVTFSALALAIVFLGGDLNGSATFDDPFSTPQPTENVGPAFVRNWSSNEAQAINIAISDNRVKEWLGEGYLVESVVEDSSEQNVSWVTIHTNAQKLPWVTGITLRVPVSLATQEASVINFDLTLAQLSEEQKAAVVSVAQNTSKEHGVEIGIGDVSIGYWTSYADGKDMFFAYPYVEFRDPPDWNRSGMIMRVFVDLEKGEVAKVLTSYSKPFPPGVP